MYENSENCYDCELNGITDTVSDWFSTGKELVTDVITQAPDIYRAKKIEEQKQAQIKDAYLKRMAQIKAETETRRKELEAQEAKMATAAANQAGVKSPAGMAHTTQWIKDNAVLFTLGIAGIGLLLRLKEKK